MSLVNILDKDPAGLSQSWTKLHCNRLIVDGQTTLSGGLFDAPILPANINTLGANPNDVILYNGVNAQWGPEPGGGEPEFLNFYLLNLQNTNLNPAINILFDDIGFDNIGAAINYNNITGEFTANEDMIVRIDFQTQITDNNSSIAFSIIVNGLIVSTKVASCPPLPDIPDSRGGIHIFWQGVVLDTQIFVISATFQVENINGLPAPRDNNIGGGDRSTAILVTKYD